MANMDYKIYKKKSIKIVEFKGSININNSNDIIQLVKTKLVANNNLYVLFDLNRVDYIDSAGMGVFLSARSFFNKHDGDLGLVAPSENVSKVLNYAGFNKIFKIYKSIEEGCKKIK